MQGIEEYKAVTNHNIMEELVQTHSGLVMKIAKSIKRKLPAHVELEDMVQAGFIGLLEASKNYKSDQGATFETFASIRIKGAIIDELRKNSWNSRDTMKRLKEMSIAANKIEQLNMRPATSEEIAAEMNMSLEEFDKMCQVINASNVTCMSEINDFAFLTSDEVSPEAEIVDKNLKHMIKQSLEHLPEREQILLSLYYIEELSFKEIGEVLELTEARVSQIHASLLAKLAKKFELT